MMVDQAKTRQIKWIVLVTPPLMATGDNPNISPADRHYTERIVHAQISGMLAQYANAVREVGLQMGVPVADVYAQWEALAKAGVDTNTMLANGLNHPTAEAHEIHAKAILDAIETMAD